METQHSTPLESVREGSSEGVPSSSSSLTLADLADEGGPLEQAEPVLDAGTEQEANVREGGLEECTGGGGHGSSQMVHDYLGDRCVCVCVCVCVGVTALVCVCCWVRVVEASRVCPRMRMMCHCLLRRVPVHDCERERALGWVGMWRSAVKVTDACAQCRCYAVYHKCVLLQYNVYIRERIYSD